MSSIASIENNRGIVHLDGNLTLSQAVEIKALFIKALVSADEVNISFGEVPDVDLSCLQLICSAHRSALRLNKKLAIKGNAPQAFKDAMSAAGYSRLKGCKLDKDQSCVWSGLCGDGHV